MPIETSSRELLYKTYLCHLLAARGYTCYLGSKSTISYLMRRFQDYLYLDKGYHVGVSDRMYDQIHQQGGSIINLDEEGAVDYADHSTLAGRYSKQLFDQSSLVLFWGQQQRDLVPEAYTRKTRTAVTGHPRFELLKEQHQYLYAEEVNRLRGRYSNFILINTNMGFGNNIRGDVFVRRNYGPRFKQIDRIIEFDKQKLQAYIKLVRALASESGKRIVLRPHPEESKEVYEQALSDLADVDVVFEGSVVPWLIAADLMIHPDCTTALESYFIGKIPLSFLPASYPEDLVTTLPLTASYQFDNLESIRSAVINPAEHKLDLEESCKTEIENYFSYSKASSELVVAEIEKLTPALNGGSVISLKDWLTLHYRRIRKSIRSGSGSQLINNKLDGFDLASVSRLSQRISTNSDRPKKVQLKAIVPRLIKFSPEHRRHAEGDE